MELKHLIHTMQQQAALRELVPLNQGLLYPWFTVNDGQLCIHFLAHASGKTETGRLLYPPAYHVAALPNGQLVCVQALRYHPAFAGEDFTAATLVEKPEPGRKEQIVRLTELADEILGQWAATGHAELDAYHTLLCQVLTEQQVRMYRTVTGCV